MSVHGKYIRETFIGTIIAFINVTEPIFHFFVCLSVRFSQKRLNWFNLKQLWLLGSGKLSLKFCVCFITIGSQIKLVYQFKIVVWQLAITKTIILYNCFINFTESLVLNVLLFDVVCINIIYMIKKNTEITRYSIPQYKLTSGSMEPIIKYYSAYNEHSWDILWSSHVVPVISYT